MSENNQEILAVMKALGSGTNTDKKLVYNPRTGKIERVKAGQDNPDKIPEIDATDAVVFSI